MKKYLFLAATFLVCPPATYASEKDKEGYPPIIEQALKMVTKENFPIAPNTISTNTPFSAQHPQFSKIVYHHIRQIMGSQHRLQDQHTTPTAGGYANPGLLPPGTHFNTSTHHIELDELKQRVGQDLQSLFEDHNEAPKKLAPVFSSKRHFFTLKNPEIISDWHRMMALMEVQKDLGLEEETVESFFAREKPTDDGSTQIPKKIAAPATAGLLGFATQLFSNPKKTKKAVKKSSDEGDDDLDLSITDVPKEGRETN